MVEISLLIVALTELSKQYLPSKYAPLLATDLGLAYGLYYDLSIAGALSGLAIGLGTTGLYRAAKSIIK